MTMIMTRRYGPAIALAALTSILLATAASANVHARAPKSAAAGRAGGCAFDYVTYTITEPGKGQVKRRVKACSTKA